MFYIFVTDLQFGIDLSVFTIVSRSVSVLSVYDNNLVELYRGKASGQTWGEVADWGLEPFWKYPR